MESFASSVQMSVVEWLGKDSSGGPVTPQHEFTGISMVLLHDKNPQSIQLNHFKSRRLIPPLDWQPYEMFLVVV